MGHGITKFWNAISHIPGERNVVADCLSRCPIGLEARHLHAIRLSDFAVGTHQLRIGSLGVVDCWAGPYRVLSPQANNVVLEDITGGLSMTVDVSRLKPFWLDPGVDPQAVAAADMGEVQVLRVLAHKGSERNRGTLEFKVEWSDGDITWEPWDHVKKLTAVDDYIQERGGKGFKALLQRK